MLARYVWLWIFGLALGWFEAAVVVYLRALYYPEGFGLPLVMIPSDIALVEIVREAASLVILAAVARLAASRGLERFAAFALLFGVWDLFYYVALKLVLIWPPAPTTWDVLFLIPVPWLGPVWAPCVVSLALVTGGSLILLSPETERRYRAWEWALAVLGGVAVIASFVANWRPAVEGRLPDPFPAGLFWAGWLLSVVVMTRAEMRARRSS
jgi:hypothetical protein